MQFFPVARSDLRSVPVQVPRQQVLVGKHNESFCSQSSLLHSSESEQLPPVTTRGLMTYRHELFSSEDSVQGVFLRELRHSLADFESYETLPALTDARRVPKSGKVPNSHDFLLSQIPQRTPHAQYEVASSAENLSIGTSASSPSHPAKLDDQTQIRAKNASFFTASSVTSLRLNATHYRPNFN